MSSEKQLRVTAELVYGPVGVGRAIVSLDSSIFYNPTKENIDQIIEVYDRILVEEHKHQICLTHGKALDEKYETRQVDEVFSKFVKDEIKSQIKSYMLDHHLNLSSAFVKAVNTNLNQNRRSISSPLYKDFKYFIQRLAIKIETHFVQDTMRDAKDDFVMIVSDFYREYYYKPSKYLKGIICHSFPTSEEKQLAYMLSTELNIPVCQYKGIIEHNTEIIIDSSNNQIIMNPSSEVLEDFKSQINQRQDSTIIYDPTLIAPGYKVYASTANVNEVDSIASNDIYSGICVYKTECSFTANRGTPKLEEVFEEYLEVFRRSNGKEIFINLPDFRKEMTIEEMNGESIDRYSFLGNLYTFDTWLKAIAKAVEITNVDVKIAIPQIRIDNEFDFFKDTIEVFFEEQGLSIPKVGILIETETAMENFEEYPLFDFTIIALDNLIEEYSEPSEYLDRYRDVSKERFLELLLLNLRDIHRYYMSLSGRTRHIVMGRCLKNQGILQRIYGMGFTEISVPINNIKDVIPQLSTSLLKVKKHFSRHNMKEKKKIEEKM